MNCLCLKTRIIRWTYGLTYIVFHVPSNVSRTPWSSTETVRQQIHVTELQEMSSSATDAKVLMRVKKSFSVFGAIFLKL